MLSVILGSFDEDLWIAASTALVSFFSSWLEYGNYSQVRMVTTILSHDRMVHDTSREFPVFVTRGMYSSYARVIAAWLLQRVRTLNTSIKMLEQAWQDWHGLTFHEKRQPVNFDRLVRQTEAAIMRQYEDDFQPSRGAVTKAEASNTGDDESNNDATSKRGAGRRNV
jgi:hypothetical protein